MDTVLSALWPIFALLVLGQLGRRYQFPGDGFWLPAEKLTYFVLFPAMLVDKLGRADMSGVPLLEVAIVVVGLLMVGTLICYLIKPWLKVSAPTFTSFYQGSIRFNTYVAIAAAAALLNEQAIAVSAVIIGLMIPLINLLCILVFSMHTSASPSVLGVFKNLLKNPLILACLGGITLNVTGLGVPEMAHSVAALLGSMALPLGLLAVGAGLNLSTLRTGQMTIWASSLVKLLLFPLIVFGLSKAMGFSPEMVGLFTIFAAVPTAPSGYILARQLGGDTEQMAAIITGQTLLSFLSMPIVLSFVL
jgi:malonate transporter